MDPLAGAPLREDSLQTVPTSALLIIQRHNKKPGAHIYLSYEVHGAETNTVDTYTHHTAPSY